MDREKMQQNPLPIDRVAARVVRAARPEHLWRPMPKDATSRAFSTIQLEVAPLPREAPKNLYDLIGKRRDRFVIVGYAKEQGAPKQQARWVVRCDCGNYEHRKRILRWLGTDAQDMCAECRNRTFKLRGEWASPIPATRSTSRALKTAEES